VENTHRLTLENVYLNALAFLPKTSFSSAGAMCSAISTFTIQNRVRVRVTVGSDSVTLKDRNVIYENRVCCSVLPSVAECCSVSQRFTVFCSVGGVLHLDKRFKTAPVTLLL